MARNSQNQQGSVTREESRAGVITSAERSVGLLGQHHIRCENGGRALRRVSLGKRGHLLQQPLLLHLDPISELSTTGDPFPIPKASYPFLSRLHAVVEGTTWRCQRRAAVEAARGDPREGIKSPRGLCFLRHCTLELGRSDG